MGVHSAMDLGYFELIDRAIRIYIPEFNRRRQRAEYSAINGECIAVSMAAFCDDICDNGLWTRDGISTGNVIEDVDGSTPQYCRILTMFYEVNRGWIERN